MMPTGQVMTNYTLYLQESTDNCTPANMLVFSIRKSGTGTGFPLNPDGTPQTTVSFDCSELGFQLVELWAMDMHGNADYCTTFMHVQDNAGVCGSNATVAGAVITEMGQGLEEAHVEIACNAPTGQPPVNLFDVTDVDGKFKFNNAIPIQCNYVLTPVKDNDPLNGVSTYDLVLINKHILGLQPLKSPYSMIAADANGSGSVTTIDVVELRKLILGIYDELPSSTSWRFVEKSYHFPNPSNPFQEIFPESKWVWNVQSSHPEDDFVAIKVGDVNSNSIANNLNMVDDRSEGTLLFDVDDRFVSAGEQFTVAFTAAEKATGYQFTVNHPGLELMHIRPGDGLHDDNFAAFADKEAFTTSAEIPDNVDYATFEVSFRAKTNGQLSKMISISSRITRAEAYLNNGVNGVNDGVVKSDVAFRFRQAGGYTINGLGFELYQNNPNPWVHKTQIGFHLPEAAEATLKVYDEIGRALFSETAGYPKGYNAILIEHALLDAPGVLYYTLETPFGTATRKMIQSR